MKKALLFAGQGSQTVGMGYDFYENFPVARAVFEEVNDALDMNLSAVIFDGTDADLTLTQNAQPALMALSIAIWRVLQSELGVTVTDFSYSAGHSLGQYSALCATEALSLSDTARLLRARGEAMAEACENTHGKMAALIGLDKKTAQEVATESKTFIANDNATGQIVLSGTDLGIQNACEIALQKGAKRALALNVAGAFHSPLMQAAADKMQAVLMNANVQNAKIPVVSNVTAEPIFKAEEIKKDLVLQITGQVEWTKTQHFLKQNGVEMALELGAGKVLAGLMKRTEPEIQVFSINDIASLNAYMEKGENENV